MYKYFYLSGFLKFHINGHFALREDSLSSKCAYCEQFFLFPNRF